MRLQEVEQAEQLFHAVLQRRPREEDAVLHAQSLEALQQLAVPVLQPVRFVNDHRTPVNVLQLTVVGCGEWGERSRRSSVQVLGVGECTCTMYMYMYLHSMTS